MIGTKAGVWFELGLTLWLAVPSATGIPPRCQIVPAKALRDDVAVDRDFPINFLAVGQIIFIGGFITDGFHLPGRNDRAVIDAKGKVFQQGSLIAKESG